MALDLNTPGHSRGKQSRMPSRSSGCVVTMSSEEVSVKRPEVLRLVLGHECDAREQLMDGRDVRFRRSSLRAPSRAP